jgi:glycerophosphoryl diester phosphodiesterase
MFTENQIIGHRGASGYAPENTLASFHQAHELGCRLVEFDVKLSLDGEAFIFHDDNLQRTTDGKGDFSSAHQDYVKSLDAGSWFSKRFRGEKILTLREMLLWMADREMNANIEIKPSPGAEEATTTEVLKNIHQHWPKHKALPLVSSFDQKSLSICRNLMPEMPIGILLDKWQPNWLQLAQDLDCFSIHLNRRAITQTRVQEIKSHGYKIAVYTVNQKYQAARLFALGVDVVFSDYPDLMSHSTYIPLKLKRSKRRH